MSRMTTGAEGNAYTDLDDGEIPPEPYNPDMPSLRGGDDSSRPYGCNGYSRRWTGASASGINASGKFASYGTEGLAENDFHEVPAAEFYAARRRRRQRRPAGRRAPAADHFDFNDQAQPNPWQGAAPQPQRPREPEYRHEPKPETEVRRFAACRDDRDLRTYMDERHISIGFLTEIDQFLQGHPEIATCVEGRKVLHLLYILPPLEAYKYFLKGYTRPARYQDGIVRTDNFPLPLGYPYQPLSTKIDPELVDFFDDFEYRHDIIDRIDQDVHMAMRQLAFGRSVPLALRKLVCYAIWGNPVDAYKWFEYSYQQEYMPHRYLPEHVVLGHIPKPAGYKEPRPCSDSSYKKHGEVRARMARANDQGVDVLDVLMAEYRFALVRKGHRRLEIDGFVAKAKQRLKNERQDPTGVDIVDLIMEDAVARQGTNRRTIPRRTYHRNHTTANLGTHRITINGVKINGGRHTFTRVIERRAAGFLQAEASDLQAAKAILLRLYNQEQQSLMKRGPNALESTLHLVRSSRATAERRYVNCLIRYCRAANRMTSTQANELQKNFTREKMGEMGLPNSNYLLGLYPRELY